MHLAHMPCSCRLWVTPSLRCFLASPAQILHFRSQEVTEPPVPCLQDCWNRPICSAPDAHIQVMERTPVSGQK